MTKLTPSEAASIAGRVGGPARAASMTPERRSQIASDAAKKRWAAKKMLDGDT
jgi:hypothetical protein